MPSFGEYQIATGVLKLFRTQNCIHSCLPSRRPGTYDLKFNETPWKFIKDDTSAVASRCYVFTELFSLTKSVVSEIFYTVLALFQCQP
jgi:hypothetical protein